MNRRHFLRAGAAGLVLPTVLLADRDRPKPSERINLGLIGVGTMGRYHLGAFLGMNDVQVVAIAEVVRERREDAKKRVETHYGKDQKREYRGCHAYNDFRDLLRRDDIDAVVIATPDHWHTIPCVMAARAKKDVYCEKPLTLTIGEGKKNFFHVYTPAVGDRYVLAVSHGDKLEVRVPAGAGLIVTNQGDVRSKDALRSSGALTGAVGQEKEQVLTLGLHDRVEVSLGVA